MKNTILIFFIAAFSLTGFSQSKVGTVDVEYIISQMPELAQVQDSLRQYAGTLDAQLQDKMNVYNKKVEEYQKAEAAMTEQEKVKMQEEIFTLENDINKFRQNGIKMMQLREDELKRPLYQKIGISLEKVAKANAYTQVLDLNANSDIVFFNPDYDLTALILKDLGIATEN